MNPSADSAFEETKGDKMLEWCNSLPQTEEMRLKFEEYFEFIVNSGLEIDKAKVFERGDDYEDGCFNYEDPETRGAWNLFVATWHRSQLRITAPTLTWDMVEKIWPTEDEFLDIYTACRGTDWKGLAIQPSFYERLRDEIKKRAEKL